MKKVKISGLQIFSLMGGGSAIMAKIDGKKVGPVKMSREDVNSLTDKTDRRKLAEKYLIDNEAN